MATPSTPMAEPPLHSSSATELKRKLPPLMISQGEPKRSKKIGGFLIEDVGDDEESLSLEEGPASGLGLLDIVADKLRRGSPIFVSSPPFSPADHDQNMTDIENPTSPTYGNLQSEDNPLSSDDNCTSVVINSSPGVTHTYRCKPSKKPFSYKEYAAELSKTKPGKAQRSYYGIEIHRLLDQAKLAIETDRRIRAEVPRFCIDDVLPDELKRARSTLMWTEKYRARKFADLVGDDRVNRSVMFWLKKWDPIVFPKKRRRKPWKKSPFDDGKPLRKILLLTGPPGLGKTTLAHVCAQQAGYEPLEINASDERSRSVVNGRIKDIVGTQNVRGINVKTAHGTVRQNAQPICVIIDEVDGVVGGGDGGFMAALLELVSLDQRNSARAAQKKTSKAPRREKKGDKFRLLRPLILICNDLYHPSLRSLRSSNLAEIIYVRGAPLGRVAARLKSIFELEKIPCDIGAAQKICEFTWGISGKNGMEDSGNGEGDLRSVLVAGEWVAGKFRNSIASRLTREWVENEITKPESGFQGNGTRTGSVRDIVDRVFVEGGGFFSSLASSRAKATMKTDTTRFYRPQPVADDNLPKSADPLKRQTMERLREIVDSTGEHDRILMWCFGSYPLRIFQDDTILSKPDAAYEWLYFHDQCSSRIHQVQEWELYPYLSQCILAFHYIFATVARLKWSGWNNTNTYKDPNSDNSDNVNKNPFLGIRADVAAYEIHRANTSTLVSFRSIFSPRLRCTYRSPEHIAMELIPLLNYIIAPNVDPVVIGDICTTGTARVWVGHQRAKVNRAVDLMALFHISYERMRVVDTKDNKPWNPNMGYIFRMIPPIDTLVLFNTSPVIIRTPVRYCVRMVLQSEFTRMHPPIEEIRSTISTYAQGQIRLRRERRKKEAAAMPIISSKPCRERPKRDFWGEIITDVEEEPQRIWIKHHIGHCTAVNKPVYLHRLVKMLQK